MKTSQQRLRLFLPALVMATAGMSAAPAPADAYFRTYHTRGDLIEELEKDGRFSVLLTALGASGLDAAVADANVTLFAPTDAAFQPLIDAGVIDDLLAEPELATLKNILLYHVVEGRASTYQLERTRTPETLLGEPVILKRTDDGLLVNDSKIVDGNQRARRGTYHAIDAVLLPPEQSIEIESILDVLRFDGRFNVLLTALEATGLDDAVASGELTLFAPTDDAFQPLIDAGVVDDLLAEPELTTLKSILLYHVVDGRQSALKLYFDSTSTTLQGTDVAISYQRGGLFINDARVISANGHAPNGVIHIIDGVLLPTAEPEDLVALLQADGRFTVLLAALEATGLDAAVAAGGLTVFAPTDEAFQPLIDDGTIDALLAEPGLVTLEQILLYHVVSGESTAKDLIRKRRVETLQGSNVYVRWFFGKVFVNRERVIDANLRAGTGIAHAIDGVLLPGSH
jgi:transforming growth factor-beta-induced protein